MIVEISLTATVTCRVSSTESGKGYLGIWPTLVTSSHPCKKVRLPSRTHLRFRLSFRSAELLKKYPAIERKAPSSEGGGCSVLRNGCAS
jgi:hypothetical protein